MSRRLCVLPQIPVFLLTLAAAVLLLFYKSQATGSLDLGLRVPSHRQLLQDGRRVVEGFALAAVGTTTKGIDVVMTDIEEPKEEPPNEQPATKKSKDELLYGGEPETDSDRKQADRDHSVVHKATDLPEKRDLLTLPKGCKGSGPTPVNFKKRKKRVRSHAEGASTFCSW